MKCPKCNRETETFLEILQISVEGQCWACDKEVGPINKCKECGVDLCLFEHSNDCSEAKLSDVM